MHWMLDKRSGPMFVVVLSVSKFLQSSAAETPGLLDFDQI
jgi:hypothetical protein